MKSICKKSFIKNIQQKVAVVDTRSMQSFSKGFVRGSVFIGWNESFIKWLAYFVTKEKPFIIVVSKENVHEIVAT
jgi:hydroxyacylglutathione hydrolase